MSSRFLFFTLLITAALPATAKDRLLVIAGGHQASQNQVSLEKNVLFFRKVTRELAPEAPVSEFFSSGNEPIRSLQFETADSSVPAANEYMARLFGTTRYLKLHYRQHQLNQVEGSTSLTNLNRWFDENASSFRTGDRLVIYVTAHGAKSTDKTKPYNTRIRLWNRQTLDVRGLQTNLKKLPADTPVTLIMAQCYSGGFAHTLFQDSDSGSGFFDRPVCGFFATVHTRESAGCTPDINEENYDEFTSHFWAAIRGRDRMGNPVSSADLDGEAGISFEEAHAYTILTSRNIDIPMKSSGAFLRARSQYADEKGKENDRLLLRHTDYSQTLKLADPVGRATLEGLSSHLNLRGEERYAATEKHATSLERQQADLRKQLQDEKRILDSHRDSIRDALYARWPELSNVHTEQAVRLLRESSAEFVRVIEEHPRFAAWNQGQEKRDRLEEERFALEKKWAHYIRFMRAHNNVVLEENLRRLNHSKDWTRYQSIRALERAGLAGSAPSS